MLPLAAASLAACIQLRSPGAPDESSSHALEATAADSAPVFVDSSSGGHADHANGLPAYPLALGGTLVVRSQPVRALPELRALRGSGVAARDSQEAAERFANAIDDPEPEADENEASELDPDAGEGELSELPRGTMVLHVGDSFAGALGVPLGKRLKAAGLRSVLQFKKASYIPTWAFGDELRINIKRYKPDLVLVSLGANEIELRVPMQRIYAIKRLVATLGPRPCVWISPPSWKPDAGLLAVIRENISPCRYLDSDALVPYLPRGPDSIHPSRRGREMWADAVLDWLSRERDPSGPQPWQLRSGGHLEPTANFQGGFPARRAAQP